MGDFSRTLDFAGLHNETVTVTVPLDNELLVEGDESFTVALNNLVLHEATPQWSAGSNGPVSLPTAATELTITNTDQATVTIDDVRVTEGSGGGMTAVTLTLALDNPVEGGFFVEVTPAFGATDPTEAEDFSGRRPAGGAVGGIQR